MKEKLNAMRERVEKARRLIAEAEKNNDTAKAEEARKLAQLVNLECDSALLTNMDDSTFNKMSAIATECKSLMLRIERFYSR